MRTMQACFWWVLKDLPMSFGHDPHILQLGLLPWHWIGCFHIQMHASGMPGQDSAMTGQLESSWESPCCHAWKKKSPRGCTSSICWKECPRSPSFSIMVVSPLRPFKSNLWMVLPPSLWLCFLINIFFYFSIDFMFRDSPSPPRPEDVKVYKLQSLSLENKRGLKKKMLWTTLPLMYICEVFYPSWFYMYSFYIVQIILTL